MAIDEKEVMAALGRVKDPEIDATLMDLNMIRDVRVDGSTVTLTVLLTTPACPLKRKIEEDVHNALMGVAGVQTVKITMGAQTPHGGPWAESSREQLIPGVAHVIAVGSGKGGVGKSTVAVNLAVALAQQGAAVGLLDADIYGPSVPQLMNVRECKVDASNRTIIPAEKYGIKILSAGFFLNDSDPVIWRGPMLHGVMRQFLGEVRWDRLDYLIVDLPPGTGDVVLSLVQLIPLSAAVVVTTPQDVALLDVRRAVQMFRKVHVEVAGVVENMSEFECPHCHKTTHIFGQGGAEKLQKEFQIPLLGRIALTTTVMESAEKGVPIVVSHKESAAAQAFVNAAGQVAARVSVLAHQQNNVGEFVNRLCRETKTQDSKERGK